MGTVEPGAPSLIVQLPAVAQLVLIAPVHVKRLSRNCEVMAALLLKLLLLSASQLTEGLG